MAEIEGSTTARFDGVREAFAANFENGLEVGAAFSAYHRGEKVVDLWGGTADTATGREWDTNTIVLVYSTTKGITATLANRLAGDGRLDVDAPVVTYWPTFRGGGKERITVADLLSHQAGLAWVDAEMTAEEAFSWDPVISALEHQTPHYEPRSQHGYHAVTYGWLVGEVIRRVTGKTVGAALHDEIATPLGLRTWIGLPESEEPHVATLTSMLPDNITLESLRSPGNDEVLKLASQFIGPDTALGKALFAPGYALASQELWNTRAMRAAEIPSVNGMSDARSLARLYAACIGEVDGFRAFDDTQLKLATTQLTEGPNRILLDMDIQFGLGFMLHTSLLQIGGPRSFGHFGAGGSMGWTDPDAELAFGYVMNRMDLGLAGDARSFNLVRACFDAIG